MVCFIDEDIEIEMVEEEAPFLQGVGGRGGLDLSPVKIVKVDISVAVNNFEKMRGWQFPTSIFLMDIFFLLNGIGIIQSGSLQK